MDLQDRDVGVLTDLADYFLLTARQVRELRFPSDKGGRVTRRRLGKLAEAGLVRKRRMMVVSPRDGAATPVYHLTRRGVEFVAEHTGDESVLLKPHEPSQPQHLYHYAAVAETHRLFRDTVSLHDDVTLARWVNEDEPIGLNESGKPRRLRTDFQGSRRITAVPDAAAVVEYAGHAAVLYLEQDRDSFSANRTAARKSPGYRAMLAAQTHAKHFPVCRLPHFFVLLVAPSRRRADSLRKAFANTNEGEESARLYRFGSAEELTPENILFEPVWRDCLRDEPVPLIRRVT